MYPRFRRLSLQIQTLYRPTSSLYTTFDTPFIHSKIHVAAVPIQLYLKHFSSISCSNHNPPTDQLLQNPPETDHEALKIQSLLKFHYHRPTQEIEQHLDQCCNFTLSQDLVLNVLKRHRSDWKSAYSFFNWVRNPKNSTGFPTTVSIYNEMLDILGRMKRFDEFHQVFDEMSSRKNFINSATYGIVVSRFSAAHKVKDAIGFFDKIQEFGLERDLVAFQTLLLSLCRYKHVEEAEVLFRNKKSEFIDDIKTWNIILNGWCVRRSLRDAKRFWKDIVTSNCKPDKYTYGIFINSLTKSGKISTAMKLLKTMWDQGCKPDPTICNNVIDGLCFKKRIPEALEIFQEMNERDIKPNGATYNSLIKHLCKIQRMEKVHELLNEMEEPNGLTYVYLLNCTKKAEEVDEILERMMKSGCRIESDAYNLVLRLFMEWGDLERVKCTWDEMERSGVGPDRRSYTVMIHGFYDKGMMSDALEYYSEMMSKGMVLEVKTKLLVNDMESKLNVPVR